MKAFADLFQELDQTNSTNEKVDAMAKFFRTQDPETSAWALYFLSGRRPKRAIGSGKLRSWIQEMVGYQDWLMEECYAAVGDTAEMVALIAGANRNDSNSQSSPSSELSHSSVPGHSPSLGEWMTERILPLKALDESEQKHQVTQWWSELDTHEIFVLNKFITGGLRVGVSETLVLRALEAVTELPRAVIATRLFGEWTPSADFFLKLHASVHESEASTSEALPVPFCLAAPLDGSPADLGDASDWLIEWKWDGIRCQIVKTQQSVEIWSRGEERITDSFPDLARDAATLPGEWTLDGELVAGHGGLPLPFQDLQRRLNRKKPSASLQKQVPVFYLAYDILREGSERFTELSLVDRRKRLAKLIESAAHPRFRLSSPLEISDWGEATRERERSRQMGAEGLMIKKKSAPYEVGRKRGIWYKWKVDPLTIDAVLTSAQPGTGRRASLYTDYTFSIWREGKLVPVAKAYSGLKDEEIRSLDHWIRRHTIERYGPVRSVEPLRVFELGFEGIAESSRHKSGFAVRFPRILRERTDKKPADADTHESVEGLLKGLREERGLVEVESPKNPQTQFELVSET